MSQSEARLPGFGLSLGIALTYLALLVLIPLSTIPLKTASMGWDRLLETATSPRALAAYRLSFTTALIAAALNGIFGLLVAWVLERYPFPGRRFVDGLVDLPFALPTAVAGITFTTLFAQRGWLGAFLEPAGIQVAYAKLGIVVALTFVGLPFVVRTVQPVIRDLPRELEEAAATLGAGRIGTIFRIVLPQVLPAVAAGVTLAFARGLGEYGSVIFIAGNVPMKTEITPLLIVIRLEEYDYEGAAAIALVFLIASFLTLLIVNVIQRRMRAGRR